MGWAGLEAVHVGPCQYHKSGESSHCLGCLGMQSSCGAAPALLCAWGGRMCHGPNRTEGSTTSWTEPLCRLDLACKPYCKPLP